MGFHCEAEGNTFLCGFSIGFFSDSANFHLALLKKKNTQKLFPVLIINLKYVYYFFAYILSFTHWASIKIYRNTGNISYLGEGGVNHPLETWFGKK